MHRDCFCRIVWLVLLVAAASAGQPLARAESALKSTLVTSAVAYPVFVTHAGDGSGRLFIVSQQGQIRIHKDGALLATPFLDLASLVTFGGERGLLGLAFHPNYAINGEFFVNYTDALGRTVVARHTVSADPDVANPSGTPVIRLDQPFANHNAGWIAFSPIDGFLYVPTGDGGSGNDPGNRAQDIENQLLGKILRIDVDGDDFPADPVRNYAIPPTNPFVGETGDDEIWAYGLRNPWREAFDRATGDLWIADVGQSAWEEINFQPAASTGGENYGWRCMEGAHCTGLTGCTCFGPTLTLPIHEYQQTGSLCAVTGGYVYRGGAVPDLQGTYLLADYCTAKIWSFRYDGQSVTDFRDRTAELAPAGSSFGRISSFGEDEAGELYVCAYPFNGVHKIEPANDCNANGLADEQEASSILADLDNDADVDGFDFLTFSNCFNGAMQPPHPDCANLCTDVDFDGDVDGTDFLTFANCFNGSLRPPACP